MCVCAEMADLSSTEPAAVSVADVPRHPWAPSRRVAVSLSARVFLLSVAAALSARWIHSRGGLSVSLTVGSSAAAVAATVAVAVVALVSWSFFRKAVGERRSVGKKGPLLTEAARRLKSLELQGEEGKDLLVGVEKAGEVLEHQREMLGRKGRLRKMPIEKEEMKEDNQGDMPAGQKMLFRHCLRLMSNLNRETFRKMYERIAWIHLDDGQCVFKAGDDCASGVFFVVEGCVKGFIQAPSGTEDRISVCEAGPGESLGDWELFDHSYQRKMTYIAVGSTELIQVSRAAFEELSIEHPELMVSFVRNTICRLWRVASFVLRDFLHVLEGIDSITHKFPTGSKNMTLDVMPSFIDQESLEKKSWETKTASESDDKSEKHLLAGDILYSQGSLSESRFFILLSGKVCVYHSAEVDEEMEDELSDLVEISSHHDFLEPEPAQSDIGSKETLYEIAPGTVVGAISCFAGCPRLESVRALTSATFAMVTIQQLELFPGELGLKLSRSIAQMLYPVVSRFIELGFERKYVNAGYTVFTDNSKVTSLYIVVSGRLRLINHQLDDTEEVIGEVGRGQCVGEMSILSGKNRHSMTVFALRDSELVRISKFMLMKAFRVYPQILRKFSFIMANRLRSFTKVDQRPRLSQNSKVLTVAILPANTEVDIELFSQNLNYALADYGDTRLINKASIQSMLEKENVSDTMDDSIYRSRVTHLMMDLEENHDIVLFSTDAELSPWAECCVRQADCVLIVTNSSSSSRMSFVEKNLIWESQKKTFSRKELVLIHEDDTIIPSGTRTWFKDRRLHSFHHVKKTHMQGYLRLARYLTGKTVGVVLGGGGARGIAHQGVLQAMEEQDVPIDYIGGTSQGAFMSAVYAYYMSNERMFPHVEKFSARMGNVWELLSDATFPTMAYFSGYKLNESIKAFFGDTRIEDLWIPYFCITTNISQADIMIHRTGVLWMAVRASMSILDYLPPMFIEGDILIDGGYCNNLPVDVMRDIHNPSLIVGVDVENKDNVYYKKVENLEYISGWRILVNKILSFLIPCYKGISIPRYSELISSLLYLNHNRSIRRFVNERFMDVYINPELGNVMLLDYHKFSEILDIGYRYGKLAITSWKLTDRNFFSQNKLKQSTSFDESASKRILVDSLKKHGSPVRSSVRLLFSPQQAKQTRIRKQSLEGLQNWKE